MAVRRSAAAAILRSQDLMRAAAAAANFSSLEVAAPPLLAQNQNLSCNTLNNSAGNYRASFSFSSAAAAYADSHTSDAGETWTATTLSPGAQRIHQELVETMNKRRIPQASLVLSLLHECSNSLDIKLALEAIARLRVTRAVQCKQQGNFSKELSCQVVDACLRVGDAAQALKVLWAHNIYGFTPSLETAHQILAYAKEQHDLDLMKKTLQTMMSNSLMPSRTTADIVIRMCKEERNVELLFLLAKEFHKNGVKFRPALYDVCISTAANAGEAKHVLEIHRWMGDLKLPPTTASAFALSKARLLQGKPKEAAQIICSQVKGSEERDMYLRVLIRAWPEEVLSRKRRSVKEVPLQNAVEEMLEELKAIGYNGKIDALQEFRTGKESIGKVVYG